MTILQTVASAVIILINLLAFGEFRHAHIIQPYVDPLGQQAAKTTPAGGLWISISDSQATSSGWTIENGSIIFDGAVDSGGSFVNRMVAADKNTFVISLTDADFGKDKNNVYYDGAIIPHANPNTLVVLGSSYDDGRHDGSYAKDNLNAYYEDSSSSGTVAPIVGAHTLSFIDCGDGYAKDAQSVYLFGRKIVRIRRRPPD